MARMTRSERSSLTRQALRTAARRAVAWNGIGGTSIERLAEAAGHTRGAFYAHYASKDEIVLELLLEHQNRALDVWRKLIMSEEDVEQILNGMASSLDAYQKNRDWVMFAAELRLNAERDPEFAKLYRPYLRELHIILREIFAGLFQKAGRRPPANIDSIVALVSSVSTSMNALEIAVGGAGASLSSGQMVALVLRGLIAIGEPIRKPEGEGAAAR